MRIPDSIIEEVSRRTDIVDLIGNYVSLKPSGSRFMGLCPFHAEKTPSFSVNPEIGAFYCFGCQKGGSVFTFVMELEGLTFPESVKFLADRVGVDVVTETDTDSGRRRKALLELYSRVAGSFSYFLNEGTQGGAARQILEDRGLSADTIADFGLGFSPRDPFWLRSFLEDKEYSAEFLRDCGLFTRANEKRSLFSGRIMFPIRNRKGEVVGFGGRLLEGDGPKYINSPETVIFRKGEELYGLHKAQKSMRTERRVVLCEGYTDVLAFHQCGVENAVAPLGTALTDNHGQTLSRTCQSAVLVFDGDDAGTRAATRVATLLEAHDVTPSVVVLDPGNDPADLLTSGGSQALLDAISSPLSVLEFLVRGDLGPNPATDPEGKSFVLDRVFPYISVMRSEVKRRESVRLAADLVGVDRDAVQRDYEQYRRGVRSRPGDGRRSTPAGPERAGNSGREFKPSSRSTATPKSHDLFLMLATLAKREQFSYVRQWVQPEDLEDPISREIYVALEEALRRDESSMELFLGRISDPEAVETIQRRLASGEFDGMSEDAIRDGVVSVRRRSLEQKIRNIETRLRQIRAVGSDDELELLGEKIYLDKELQKLKGEGG